MTERDDDDDDRPRSAHDKYMDALATRIAGAVHGAATVDVIAACSGIIGFALSELPDDEVRDEILEKAVQFMKDVCRNRLASEWNGMTEGRA